MITWLITTLYIYFIIQVVSVMFGFHNEGMKEIDESGDHELGVKSLRIPINLFTLAEDRKTREDIKKEVCSHVIIYVCMHTMIYTNCINFIVL